MTEPENSNPKLKIAIIHPDLGIGGAERLVVDAACELVSHGHDVHIFTAHHDKNRCFDETVSGLFPVTVYGDFLPRHIMYRFHAICAYIRCIFVTLCLVLLWPSFDVVLVDQVSVVIPLLRIKRSIKELSGLMHYISFARIQAAQHTTMLRKLYRKPIDMIEETTTGMANLVLVNSKFTASTFAATFHGLNMKGIKPSVLYPAVNLGQFDHSCSYKLNFLSINRFERKKNLRLAISAFALFRTFGGADVADATLTVAGGYDKRLKENVEYLEELKWLAQTEGVSDQVYFLTSCSTAERNQLLSNCLCVLYTPENEHFGIVPLEAMASRKPVIACKSGGPVETVRNGETGFLCDPSPVEFANAMLKLAADQRLAAKMGEEAHKHVANTFSTKIFGEKLNSYVLNLYHQRIE